MKYKLVFICLLLFKISLAQHCPFDGAHIIALKVLNKKGEFLKNTKAIKFYLQEVDNPMADSCTVGKGLVKKKVLNKKDFYADSKKRYKTNNYYKNLLERLADKSVLLNCNYLVNIGQAEKTCTLIQPSTSVYTNYNYMPRKFIVAYVINNKEYTIAVPNNAIYSLCTASKDLEKFAPLVIQL